MAHWYHLNLDFEDLCPMSAAAGQGARGSRVVGKQMDGCGDEGGRELGVTLFSVSAVASQDELDCTPCKFAMLSYSIISINIYQPVNLRDEM